MTTTQVAIGSKSSPLHLTPVSWREQVILDSMGPLVDMASRYGDYTGGDPLAFEFPEGQVTIQKLGDVSLVSALKLDERRLEGYIPGRFAPPPHMAFVTVSVFGDNERRRVLEYKTQPEFPVHKWLTRLASDMRLHTAHLRTNEMS